MNQQQGLSALAAIRGLAEVFASTPAPRGLLYRDFDVHGQLLYVGSTDASCDGTATRLKNGRHGGGASWTGSSGKSCRTAERATGLSRR